MQCTFNSQYFSLGLLIIENDSFVIVSANVAKKFKQRYPYIMEK